MAAALAVLAGMVVPITVATPAAAQTGPFAYVTNASLITGASTLSVIDTATDGITADPPVGEQPIAVAITPNGRRAYVANAGSNTVTVIDTTANPPAVIATVPVGNSPAGVAVTPDGSRVYVANAGSNNVSVIRTSDNTVIDTVGVNTSPQGVAVTPDGSRVYVTNAGSGNVSVILTATNTIGTTVGVGTGPSGVAVSPDGSRVYVANGGSNNVSVIATAGNFLLKNVAVDTRPQGVAVTPDGTRVYVTNRASGTVSVIRTSDNTRIATIGVGRSPQGVAVATTPNGVRAYVALTTSGTVSVIDTVGNTVLGTINVGGFPIAVAIGRGVVGETPKTPTTLTLKADKKPEKDTLGARGHDVVTLKAKLTADGRPLKSKTITFTTDSTTLCTRTTNSRGTSTCKVRSRQVNKACYTATFAGDDTYLPSTATVCVKNHHGKPRTSAGLLDQGRVNDLAEAVTSTGQPPIRHGR
ncbi:YncE family protein [Streptomyces sp. NPDC048191]|uniref:YncE family protein n=1 Tax=Streptomyces sp. NPDC048191 TaxID=3155484 RepID=UPI0033FF3240